MVKEDAHVANLPAAVPSRNDRDLSAHLEDEFGARYMNKINEKVNMLPRFELIRVRVVAGV